MVIFSLKLLNNLRKAIAGRKFPHQLAGGVALGVLLGVIPHGNLLALVVLIGILCFRVNHAMVGVVAIALSFAAARLDDYSHAIGQSVLTHPTGNQLATAAYGLPLVPWTDLNNTVVLGSLVIGLAAVLPVFMLTLPLFKWVAPAAESLAAESLAAESLATEQNTTEVASTEQAPAIIAFAARSESTPAPTSIDFQPLPETVEPSGPTRHSIALVDVSHDGLLPPRYADDQSRNRGSNERETENAPSTIPLDRVLASESDFVPTAPNEAVRIDAPAADCSDEMPTRDEMVSVETRIDIIRMNDYRADNNRGLDASSIVDGESSEPKHETEQPMDEALSYLLRQLRDSQQRKAAG